MNSTANHSRTSPRSHKHAVLRSIKQLYGNKLTASGEEIGHVKDFYFDDQRWAVRYVVVDTGSWLTGCLVLVSPHAFGDFYQDGDCLLVNLTRTQIENSPPIEAHKPVSRQYEEEYYRYYGLPSYWNGVEMWGAAGLPIAPPPSLTPRMEEARVGGASNSDDPHLRSTKALRGYHIETRDGTIGHVTDLMIDEKSWAIRHLVIETGHWYFGKEIVISPKHIDRISYEESKVYVNVTREAILDAAEYHMPRAEYRDTRKLTDSLL
jgi:sporulation protein YlmC with PRC-barrel domain